MNPIALKIDLFTEKYKPCIAKATSIPPTTLEKIATMGLELLTQYRDSYEPSIRGRLETYTKLHNFLNQMNNEIFFKMSFCKKISYVFDFIESEHALLKKALQAARLETAQAQSHYNHQWKVFFGQSIFNDYTAYLENIENPKEKIRQIYFRIIGRVPLKSKSFEGAFSTTSITSICKDLNTFKIKYRNNHEWISQLDYVLVKLLDGKKIISQLDAISWYWDKNPSDSKLLDDIAYDIVNQLTSCAIGQEVLIPWGYNHPTGGHAVLLAMKRTSVEHFTSTLINTGEGVGKFSGLFSQFGSWWSNQFPDYEIRDIPMHTLCDRGFLTKLLLLYTYSNDHCMEEVFKHWINSLAQGDKNRVYIGRRHQVQTNGTCSYDSILSWVESQLDPSLFSLFQSYITSNALQELQAELKHPDRYEKMVATLKGETYHGISAIQKLADIGLENFKQMKKHT